jgi:hypothetical protein
MKQIYIIFLLLSASCLLVKADKPQEYPFIVFVHNGYGYLPHRVSGLTNASDNYNKTLSSGVSWNVQVFYKRKAFITGLFYSGYAAKGELANSSDNLFFHYSAPQAGMLFPVHGEFSLSFNGGIGWLRYLNNSLVYGKDRRATANVFAANIGVKGVYDITERISLSAEGMLISSDLAEINVNYHNENIIVKYHSSEFNQLTFSLGIKYSF